MFRVIVCSAQLVKTCTEYWSIEQNCKAVNDSDSCKGTPHAAVKLSQDKEPQWSAVVRMGQPLSQECANAAPKYCFPSRRQQV